MQQVVHEQELARLVEAVDERIPVVDRYGNDVGYLRAEDMLGDIFETPQEIAARVAGRKPGRLPVPDHRTGDLVGHLVEEIGFVPLGSDTVDAPGG